MEQLATTEKKTLSGTENTALTRVITAITEIVTHKSDITWMAQPLEQAVYVHVSERDRFIEVVTYLSEVTRTINLELEQRGEPGQYSCHPDHDRHCLDIFYSQY